MTSVFTSRFSSRGVLLVVLCFLLTSPTSADEPEEASTAEETGTADARAADDAVRQSTLVRLRALSAFLAGGELEDPTTLFGVDPADADAVTVYLASLKRQLAERAEVEVVEPAVVDVVGEETPGEIVPPSEESPPSEETPSEEETAPPSAAPAPTEEPAQSDASGEPIELGDTPAREEDAELNLEEADLETLLARELELKVDFLERPLVERLTMLGGEHARVAEQLREAQAALDEAEANRARAERARELALREAEEAGDRAERDLARERARIESRFAELADRQREHAEQKTRRVEETHEWLEATRDIAEALSAADRGALTELRADALYDRAEHLLEDARGAFQTAREELDEGSRFPPFVPEINPEDQRFHGQPSHEEVRRALVRLAEKRAELVEEEAITRREHVQRCADDVHNLDRRRIQLLTHLSGEHRERVMGLGTRGARTASGEWLQLNENARWYLKRRPREAREVTSWLGDVFARGSTRFKLFELILLFIVCGIAIRRRDTLVERIREQAERVLAIGKNAPIWVRYAASLSPLAVVVTIWLAERWMRDLHMADELILGVRILMRYAVYRLAMSVLVTFFVRKDVIGEGPTRPERQARIAETLLAIGRTLLLLSVVLLVCDTLTSRGYLYSVVRLGAWCCGAIATWVILRRWRGEVFTSYLRSFPKGRLASFVARGRDSFWGALLLPFAFSLVAARSTVVFFRDAFMRSELSRRLLAYFFRRQIQRTVEEEGSASPTLLPEKVYVSFATQAIDDQLRVDHFPFLAETELALAAWMAGEPAVARALVGEQGIGKSTWMAEFARRVTDLDADLDPTYAVLDETLTTEAEVCRFVSDLLGDPVVDTMEELVANLDDNERRVVLLDHCQNLVLRAIGGMNGLNAFTQILRHTSDRVFWVCSFSRYSWEHVRYVLQGEDAFEEVLVMPKWTEAQITELIDRRIEKANVQVSYDAFLTTQEAREQERERAELRQRFFRLAWDNADGIPRAAMRGFLASLTMGAEGVVDVRPTSAADANELESLQDQGLFVLHAVVLHENLSLEELSRVLPLGRGMGHSVLRLLCSRGYLVNQLGRYRVNPDWERAVVRFLRRKHLLHT